MSSAHLRGGSIWRWLPLAVFALYAILPTHNYYWDGVSFAQDIEQAGPVGSASFWLNLIHPNHLLYNFIGYAAWRPLHAWGLQIRAITVLQAINMALAALCVFVLQRTLLRLTRPVYLSTTLTLLFALSAIFWRFATDADAYIPSVLFLVASFHVLVTSSKPRPLLAGGLHVGAMLIHQLAIFFFPAAALGIYLKGGRRGLLQYCAITAGVTLPAYYAGFRLQERTTSLGAFLRWLTYHSADSAFTFSFFRNSALTLANYPRLFFGGTARLLQYFGPFMLITIILLTVVLAVLVSRLFRHGKELRLLDAGLGLDVPALVAIVWLATYAVFLFFWLPANTFYKLFCLPAIIVILAHIFARYETHAYADKRPRRYRLALLVATMALANLAFYIFPYSRPDYNQAVRFAHRMSHVWPDHTVVYYSDFIVDDWYIRYFNPGTTWKQIDAARGVAGFASGAEHEIADGHEVWLDSTAACALAQSLANATAHFQSSQEDNFPKHPIRFYRWSSRASKTDAEQRLLLQ